MSSIGQVEMPFRESERKSESFPRFDQEVPFHVRDVSIKYNSINSLVYSVPDSPTHAPTAYLTVHDKLD